MRGKVRFARGRGVCAKNSLVPCGWQVVIQSATCHRVSQAQPEIAAAGGSSGVAAAPGRAFCFVREKAFILGVMGIGKGSLGGLPPRSPCPAGGSYPRV